TNRLRRSTYVVFLVLFYAALVLFSWVVICRLSYRPITTSDYGVGLDKDDPSLYSDLNAPEAFRRNERWHRAARVVQSLAAVLTVPVTSAVCSSAVVVYLQHGPGGRAPRLSLRQMAVLADKGWTDVATLFRVGQWPRYRSSLLIWAVLLHILGAIISPVQQLFITPDTIKTPTSANAVDSLLDIPNRFIGDEADADATVTLARKLFAATSGDDLATQLWAERTDCSLFNVNYTDTQSLLCSQSGVTWGNMSMLSDPFLAQL
ncbi:hypothetical protein BO71DRAFT_290388, partial [Aspergillus ellipticus CBS 707.79]